MPFDGILTHALVDELKNKLIHGRIRKIFQPEVDEIKLSINNQKENYNLLISANSGNSRIHLTEINKKNPDSPPTFCMTLRKQIVGAEIIDIKQLESDRVIIIELKSFNKFGEPIIKNLICEITGHNSNIILTKKENNKEIIIDSIKKVGSLKSQYRHILPGLEYIAPPSKNKHSLLSFNKSEFSEQIKSSSETIENFFKNYFLGISPVIIREISFLSNLEPNENLNKINKEDLELLIKNFYKLLESEKKPLLFNSKDNQILDFHVINLKHLSNNKTEFKSLSQLLESFYSLRDKRAHFRTKSQNLKHQIETLRKKDAKKIQNLHRDLRKSQNNENNKLYGDLITANIWQLEKGLKEAVLIDYSSESLREVKVPLKVNETPAQNAQRFYKKYSKNKRAQEELQKQIKKTEEELEYIQSLLNSLETSIEIEDLNEIQYEFNHSDLVSKKKRKGKKTQLKPAQPLHYISSEGFDIFVGKNNYQNDYISTELGTAEDCWLHVKDAPGSHVLIVANGKFITEQTVLEGGMLAAYYSKLRQSENVPVDYMEFKFVKKPKNAKPGQVIFTEHNTMFITPDITKINEIKLIN